MAVQFTLKCDDCGQFIVTSKVSVKDARAKAQLQRGGYCGAGRDLCRQCRKSRMLPPATSPAPSHSISTGTAR